MIKISPKLQEQRLYSFEVSAGTLHKTVIKRICIFPLHTKKHRISIIQSFYFYIFGEYFLNMVLKNKIERISTLILYSGFVILIAITFLNGNPPLFDEVLFITNISLFEEYGLSKEFLLRMQDQAPGPLYQLIHYPVKLVAGINAPWFRLVNIAGLILITATIYLIHKLQANKKALNSAALIIAVPMIWQVSGMALTEIPAMLMSIISAFFLIYTLTADIRHGYAKAALFVLSGLFLGLAILGRSTFLALFAVYLLLFLYYRNPLIILTVAIAAAVSFPVFYIWGDLMPPAQQYIGSGGIRVWFGILAFAYMGVVMLIVAPRWFVVNKPALWTAGLFFLFFTVINYLFIESTYAPLSVFLSKFMGPNLMTVYSYTISGALATLAFYFVLSSAFRLYTRRRDPVFVFFIGAALIMLATCFKISHLFSSRYVAQAVVFMLPIAYDYEDSHFTKPVRLILGMAIGFISLNTYAKLI